MTKEEFQEILRILQDKFDFDELDRIEFVLELEHKLDREFPDEWTAVY